MKWMSLRYLLCIVFFVFSQNLWAANEKEIQTVQNVYKTWCSELESAKGNPDAIVKLYAPNSLLFATFSSKILANHRGELNAYFANLTKNEDLKCVTTKLVTRVYGDFAVNMGTYTFSYKENGKEKVIPARFTFVYEKHGDQWLIVNHHSSVVP
jgi:hypothetical protein